MLCAWWTNPIHAAPLLETLASELARVESALAEQDEKAHWIGIGAVTSESLSISAANGATTEPSWRTSRVADIDMRVGTPTLDSTHKIRDAGWFESNDKVSFNLPLDDGDELAIRRAVWRAADDSYRSARKRLFKIRNNLAVKVVSEDSSDDFSPATIAVARLDVPQMDLDVDEWRNHLRAASSVFTQFEGVEDSNVSLWAHRTTRTIVTTEGTQLELPQVQFRVSLWAQATATDGMAIQVHRAFDAHTADKLPTIDELLTATKEAGVRVVDLTAAPMIEPTVAPAILRGRAAAVFFHEVLGHRVEGHRQKDEDEGQTFTDKVGEAILPRFLNVIDDPTISHINGVDLNGHYSHDDEGVRAQRTEIVTKGVLKNFLTSRSPIEATATSNGHGRRQVGHSVVARQGNLIIEATQTIPYPELRKQLRRELQRQKKPFGFIFEDITGGFTLTGRVTPNSFAVQTVGAQRVWADGRPDDLMRGGDLIGTPLTTFNEIMSASDQTATFNGTCGAESGWVPVSASAPDILIRNLEVQRSEKEHDRPPLLTAPMVNQ